MMRHNMDRSKASALCAISAVAQHIKVQLVRMEEIETTFLARHWQKPSVRLAAVQ